MEKLLNLAVTSLLFFMFSCNTHQKHEEALKSLQGKAIAINNDFMKVREEVGKLSVVIAGLYENQDKILPSIDPGKYKLSESGVLYKPVDDGGSAVFVSGYYPINETIRKAVCFTEPVDKAFIKLVKRYPEIVQVYYNDKYSYNRIYPFFDVLSQYEAKMDIPSFNFYYLADKKHNPEKKALWVNEPYVDPAGRGWMVSAIAPVYYQDSLAGVPGIDVTINTITKRYIHENVQSMEMIIDHSGMIVAAQEKIINLLSFPPLYDHKYIETIKQDTYRKEQYNIALSKDLDVRNMATEILNNGKKITDIKIKGQKFTVLTADIAELNWKLIEIMQ